MLRSFYYILTIAAVERTLIYRSAKFWVLAGIGVLLVCLFLLGTTLGTILDDSPPGEFLLEGTDAFLALYFFSYVQAILIIFVAADFRTLEENNRLDQVMLSRPMTTANWVLGKYLGVVGALVYLNLFLLVLAAIGRLFKVIFAGASFNILPSVQYFAIATLPSILFMTALVFFLVSLLRLQSLAIILSLGYVASILFYFHHKYLGLLDYGGFFAPLFWSDWIGFGDVRTLVWQRLLFTALGLALVSFSILLYPRLRQSKLSVRLTQVAALLFLMVAGGTSYHIIRAEQDRQAARRADLKAQERWVTYPLGRVTHYDLEIDHGRGAKPLRVTARLAVENPNPQALRKLVFALNGGLRVEQVQSADDAPIKFEQEHQLLVVDLGDRPLKAGGVDTLTIAYAGRIDADGFMLDRLPEDRGIINKSNGPWIKGNIAAWVDDDFAVLPAQSGWYPVPGAAAGYPYVSPRPQNFATARIRVRSNKELSAITQGTRIDERLLGDRKESTFVAGAPRPAFSLHIGAYQRLARKFGATEVELYFDDKHLADVDLFAEVADTCYQAVDRMFEILEEVAGVPYPYPKLAVVEVPTQMQVYTTRHGLDNLLVQPEVVMIDEARVSGKRFKKEFDRRTKRARRRGRDDSPKRIKRDVFIDAVLDFLLSDRYWHDGSLTSPLRNYLHFQLDLADPLLARALELELYESSERRIRDTFYPDRRGESLSGNDRMRQNDSNWAVRRRYGVELDSLLAVLTKVPLSELLPEGDGRLYRACVDFKGPPVLRLLRELVGEKNYLRALRTLLQTSAYRRVDRDGFLEAVQRQTSQNVRDFFRQWFDEATFPGYRITRAEAEKVNTGGLKIVYQVTLRVQNGEKGDGFVRVVCKSKNDEVRRNLRLGSYQEKELRFSMAEVPERVEVLPYFSRNRGRIVKQITLGHRVRRGAPEDTVLVVKSVADSLSFVLDDQDEGFFTPVSAEARYLRPRSRGRSWWEDTNPFAFGKYYFGWHYRRAGHGDYPARWETRVPKSGDYELSYHLPTGRHWLTRRLSRKFRLTIISADGKHQVDLQPQETADGWIGLGRYRFSRKKPAVVELSDTGSGFLVADAIRWEFIE